MTDWRVAGIGTFTYSVVADMALGHAMFFGAGHIENALGDWNGYFVGDQWLPAMKTTIIMTLRGSGAYSGLVARLTYDGNQISGYVVEAKGGPGDRPFSIKACKTERLESCNCVLMPGSFGPAEATFHKAVVLSEAGQATHAGRFSNEGVFLVDPANGAVTGTGTALAANGDALLWVYSGTLDSLGVAQGSVSFCGGDGQFDAAVGGFTVNVKEIPHDPADPQVVDSCYSGQGVIRY